MPRGFDRCLIVAALCLVAVVSSEAVAGDEPEKAGMSTVPRRPGASTVDVSRLSTMGPRRDNDTEVSGGEAEEAASNVMAAPLGEVMPEDLSNVQRQTTLDFKEFVKKHKKFKKYCPDLSAEDKPCVEAMRR